MEPKGDEAQVEARFGRLEIVLILTQDRSMVCNEHTIGSEILGDVVHVESRFIPFGDSVSVDAR